MDVEKGKTFVSEEEQYDLQEYGVHIEHTRVVTYHVTFSEKGMRTLIEVLDKADKALELLPDGPPPMFAKLRDELYTAYNEGVR